MRLDFDRPTRVPETRRQKHYLHFRHVVLAIRDAFMKGGQRDEAPTQSPSASVTNFPPYSVRGANTCRHMLRHERLRVINCKQVQAPEVLCAKQVVCPCGVRRVQSDKVVRAEKEPAGRCVPALTCGG